MRHVLFILGLLLFGWLPVAAHEVRPGYIEINETAVDRFDIIWKQPVRDLGPGEVAGLGLRPVFLKIARVNDSRMQRRPGVLIERFSLICTGGLIGRQIGVEGLRRTITDVFVQLHLLDDSRASLRLTAENPVQRFAGGGTGLWAYFGLGVEHLIFGLDHILFVLGGHAGQGLARACLCHHGIHTGAFHHIGFGHACRYLGAVGRGGGDDCALHSVSGRRVVATGRRTLAWRRTTHNSSLSVSASCTGSVLPVCWVISASQRPRRTRIGLI